MRTTYRSQGKLLLTGEYAVLDGALSLALPCKYGQVLTVTKKETALLHWKSLDHDQNIWFQSIFDAKELKDIEAPVSSPSIRTTLLTILKEAIKLQPEFLQECLGHEVITYLEFPREWGLGSSSTLINNIAQWANINPYTLLWNTFSGSGYDIACAQHRKPLLYQLQDSEPIVREVAFDPPFKDQLYFVYLNKKQNSRDGILRYRSREFDIQALTQKISKITEFILQSCDLEDFENLLVQHENLLSEVLELPRVQETLFPDYQGTIKSLGAWGGDFILATGNAETKHYFENMGYLTVIPYRDMIA
jgi:mevalonate kinase